MMHREEMHEGAQHLLAEMGSHTIVLGTVAETGFTKDIPLLYGLRQFSRRPAQKRTA
ncbi:hypothetical protein [Yinghuangia sp. YIM S10712]|uniref:hypothetical protein n=1 Tax=Yinghuangia sp. YIM S10712 TaxID=3436930 RepID=UPI003F53BBBD